MIWQNDKKWKEGCYCVTSTVLTLLTDSISVTYLREVSLKPTKWWVTSLIEWKNKATQAQNEQLVKRKEQRRCHFRNSQSPACKICTVPQRYIQAVKAKNDCCCYFLHSSLTGQMKHLPGIITCICTTGSTWGLQSKLYCSCLTCVSVYHFGSENAFDVATVTW